VERRNFNCHEQHKNRYKEQCFFILDNVIIDDRSIISAKDVDYRADFDI